MTSQEYEYLISGMVKSFYELVEGIENADVKSNIPKKKGQKAKINRIEGISNYKHQIDISVHAPKALILIECKKWSREVEVGHFLTFLGRILDIEQKYSGQFEVHGSIVTVKGFQKGVCTLAHHHQKVGLIIATSFDDVAIKFSERYSRFLKLQAVGLEWQPQPVPRS